MLSSLVDVKQESSASRDWVFGSPDTYSKKEAVGIARPEMAGVGIGAQSGNRRSHVVDGQRAPGDTSAL